MSEDWRARILHARQAHDLRRGTIVARTEIAAVFRRMIQTTLEPAFREVAEFAHEQGIECTVECELGGVQPRAMFVIQPSGRSIRYEMDADGMAVREIEGVHFRPMGQRMVWTSTETLQRQLTAGYARSSAAAIVQDQFRAHDVQPSV
jgi:hypothetical protein